MSLLQKLAVLLSSSTLLFAAACSDGGDGENLDAGSGTVTSESFVIDYETQPNPPEIGENQLMLTISDDSGDALLDASVEVEAWMPAHGHGSDEDPMVMEMAGGLYHVQDLALSMAGEWEITVEIKSGDEDAETVKIDLVVE